LPRTVARLLTIVVSALATTAALAFVIMMGWRAMTVLLCDGVGGGGVRYGCGQVFIVGLLICNADEKVEF
jgi:hypothetical protein